MFIFTTQIDVHVVLKTLLMLLRWKWLSLVVRVDLMVGVITGVIIDIIAKINYGCNYLQIYF